MNHISHFALFQPVLFILVKEGDSAIGKKNPALCTLHLINPSALYLSPLHLSTQMLPSSWPSEFPHDLEVLILSHCTGKSVLRLASVNRRWRDWFASDGRLGRCRAMWRWLLQPVHDPESMTTSRPDWIRPNCFARHINMNGTGWRVQGLATVDPLKGTQLIVRVMNRMRVENEISDLEELQARLLLLSAGVPPFFPFSPRIQPEVLAWFQRMENGRRMQSETDHGFVHIWKSSRSCWEFERHLVTISSNDLLIASLYIVNGLLRFTQDGTMELSYRCVYTNGPRIKSIYGQRVAMAQTIENLEWLCARSAPEWTNTEPWTLALSAVAMQQQFHVLRIS